MTDQFVIKPIVMRCTNCGLEYFTYDTEDNGLCGACVWKDKIGGKK